MKKPLRLGGMILAVLVLANCPFSHRNNAASLLGDVAVGGRAISVDRKPGSSPVIPEWYAFTISYSSLTTEASTRRLEPALRRALAETEDDQMIRVIVHLHQDGEGAKLAEAVPTRSEPLETRQEVVASLIAAADAAQAPLRSRLAQDQAAGRVASYSPLWITNAIAVTSRPSVVQEMSRHDSVSLITLDHWQRWVTHSVAAVDVADTWRHPGQTARGWPEPIEWNVSRIRADDVWHTLGISGTGALVAGIDTGVDWLHPALRTSYRGYHAHGPSEHRYSWFDATTGGALYPVDGHGHGTHTMGTMVGEGGIGVAPGAQWIAVKVLNNQGYGYDSWIHAGLQWAMAPGGDPARAPDVVNCSWGTNDPRLTTFEDDVNALRAAGILPVFANGNQGPGSGTVTSPASLPEAFSVGAVDSIDTVASFSGRGPSPWGQVRPHVAAPGVHIRSATPGGTYEETNGTSMAAPHVSAIAALLRSISPTLSITRITVAITSTAVPLGEKVPNNDTGWGRVDAFAAAAAVARPAFVTGTVWHVPVAHPEERQPIPGATVSATSQGGGGGSDKTDAAGVYSLALAPGVYDLTASAFAYKPTTVRGIRMITSATTIRDIDLAPLPTGTLEVRIVDVSNGQPVTATVHVIDTPYTVMADQGHFPLPSGAYTVRAERVGYRVFTTTATVVAGETTTRTLVLQPAPSILLVDSGRWYYQSQVGYFRQALEDLSYAYDEWPILDLREDVPTAANLLPYEVVIWSAPQDAPGYIGAGGAVSGYLEGGGRLLLTGQDIGFWDGGGTGAGWSAYYHDLLKVRFVADSAPTRVVVGEPGEIFAGQTISIAGPGGADNQDYPDVISVVDLDAAASVMHYQNTGCGGARVSTCVEYRALYLSFGFEAIAGRSARQAVMERALDWLAATPPRAGLELRSDADRMIGTAGSQVTHTIRVRHTGQIGDPDEVSLTLAGSSWPTRMSESSLMLSPCASATVTISVTIPVTATRDVRDVVTLTARSTISPTLVVSETLETKTPASVLLVDDDRWYDQQSKYTEALDATGTTYDVWETSTRGGQHGAGPTSETLGWYPVVVWWTGYDWYAPVTEEEELELRAYLQAGGRLMLSSQDFLYYRDDGQFTRECLGILRSTQDVTPTHVVGVSDNPVGSNLGTWALEYPPGYQNWSDGLTPAPNVGVAFRDQEDRGVALTRRGHDDAALFLAFPFEAIPASERSFAMERSIGWLSWLGRSTFDASPRGVGIGDVVTYTVAVKNDGPQPVTAEMSNTVPAQIALEEASLAGPGTYDPGARRLSWRDSLAPGGTITLSYRAAVLTDTADGGEIVNRAHIRLEEHSISFTRSAHVRTNAPDLSPSSFSCTPSTLRPGESTTCTLTLRNVGAADADAASARIYPPGALEMVATRPVGDQGVAEQTEQYISWSGPLRKGSTAELTFQLHAGSDLIPSVRHGMAFYEDGTGWRGESPCWLTVDPLEIYLPHLTRDD